MTKKSLLLLLFAAALATGANVHAQVCGVPLTRSIVLTADLVCQAGDAIVIGDHNIAIELNNYNIIGPNSGATRGIVSSGFDLVKIVGPGNITGFFTAVSIDGGNYHQIRDIHTAAFGYGLFLRNISDSSIETSRVGYMGLNSDPGFSARGNRIVGNDADSIHLAGCDTYKNEVANNRIHPMRVFEAVGLAHGASANLITGNKIVNGTVSLLGTSDNVIIDNIIDNTLSSWVYAGVLMGADPSSCFGWTPVDATRNLVRGNTIAGGPVGVGMSPGSILNTIFDNKIYDQTAAGLRFLAGSDDNDARGNSYRHVFPALAVDDRGRGNLWP